MPAYAGMTDKVADSVMIAIETAIVTRASAMRALVPINHTNV